MAKKKKTVFVCQDCGYETPKWLGKCPGCGAWNTMVEEVVAPETGGSSGSGGLRLGLSDAQKPQPIGEVAIDEYISVLQRKCIELKTLKKYLLQNMFCEHE